MINLLIICTESSEKNKVLHLDKTIIFFDSVLQKNKSPYPVCHKSFHLCAALHWSVSVLPSAGLFSWALCSAQFYLFFLSGS